MREAGHGARAGRTGAIAGEDREVRARKRRRSEGRGIGRNEEEIASRPRSAADGRHGRGAKFLKCGIKKSPGIRREPGQQGGTVCTAGCIRISLGKRYFGMSDNDKPKETNSSRRKPFLGRSR